MKIAQESTTTGIEHFKATVPDAVALKMKSLADLVKPDNYLQRAIDKAKGV
jgi:hypothetical protein